MKIGFDLDWTLTEWKKPPWEFAAELLNRIAVPPAPDEYGLHVFDGEMQKMLKGLFTSVYYMTECSVPKFGSRGLISLFSSMGDEIYIVTARDKKLHKPTINMVERYFPGVNEVLFVNPTDTKEKCFKKLELDVWVDDNPNDYLLACMLLIDVIVVDAPWNMNKNFRCCLRTGKSSLHVTNHLHQIKKDREYYGKGE